MAKAKPSVPASITPLEAIDMEIRALQVHQLAARPEKVARIAELNKVAYAAVKEAMTLSDEIGIPYTCSMPAGVADLYEFSDWDSSSSRC